MALRFAIEILKSVAIIIALPLGIGFAVEVVADVDDGTACEMFRPDVAHRRSPRFLGRHHRNGGDGLGSNRGRHDGHRHGVRNDA